MTETTKNQTTISDLAAWVDAFLIDRQAANLSAHTIRFYSQHLKNFTNYCHAVGVFDVENISANTLRRFLLWLEHEGRNPGGVHCHYRSVKVFLRWWELETEPGDYRDLFKKVKAPKVSANPLPPVPLADIQAMLTTCGNDWHGLRDKALLLALLDTGARAAEFAAFDVPDIDLRTGAALIRKGKGRKSRTVFIGKDARRAIRRYLGTRKDGPLWVKENGERLSYQGLRQMLRRRAELAAIDPPTPHSFRRAFAVNMLRAGVDLETLRRLMGHSDYQVLKRYLALLDSDLQRAHAQASPANQLRNLNERR